MVAPWCKLTLVAARQQVAWAMSGLGLSAACRGTGDWQDCYLLWHRRSCGNRWYPRRSPLLMLMPGIVQWGCPGSSLLHCTVSKLLFCVCACVHAAWPCAGRRPAWLKGTYRESESGIKLRSGWPYGPVSWRVRSGEGCCPGLIQVVGWQGRLVLPICWLAGGPYSLSDCWLAGAAGPAEV
jgi:hypothetical protein